LRVSGSSFCVRRFSFHTTHLRFELLDPLRCRGRIRRSIRAVRGERFIAAKIALSARVSAAVLERL